MLKGHLDAVTSSGRVAGWAYDTDNPLRPLMVCIVADDSREIAWGSAQGYREDLAAAGRAAGWCAFGVKVEPWPVKTPWQRLALVDRPTLRVIDRQDSLPYVAAEEPILRSVADVIASDPTMIQSLTQLRGCHTVFQSFIDMHGVDGFVRTAYVYLLNRPADASGLKSYRNHLRARNVTPYELLIAMADSEEYRSRPRLHSAPNTAAFPFRVE